MREKRIQKILDRVIKNIDINTDIYDSTGMIVASSDVSRIGLTEPAVRDFIRENDKTTFVHDKRTFMKFAADKTTKYVLGMEGTGKIVRNYCLLAVSLIEMYLKSITRVRSREELMRQVLLGQLSDLEFQEVVRDFKLDTQTPCCVFVIRTMGMEAEEVYRILLKAFPKNRKDIIILVDSRSVALIKMIVEDMDDDEFVQLAGAIEETVLNEASVKAYIGIGGCKSSIYQMRESYLEAIKAIEVGSIYDFNNRIYLYDGLLLERFLYEVPEEICQRFYRKFFSEDFKKILNDEMVVTIEKFFENSLNLSETARQLYIHRNTLVYRLDKIKRVLGLDLRNFHDAVTFKIMMMLERHVRECLY